MKYFHDTVMVMAVGCRGMRSLSSRLYLQGNSIQALKYPHSRQNVEGVAQD
jgi:hypothetical protein